MVECLSESSKLTFDGLGNFILNTIEEIIGRFIFIQYAGEISTRVLEEVIARVN